MAYSFDDLETEDEYGLDEPESEPPPTEGASGTQVADDDAFDDEEDLEDVEQRLEVASHYKILLKEPLFVDVDGAPAARIVERRVRGFVRKELRMLLGLDAPEQPAAREPAPSQFSDDEVRALKLLAERLLRGQEAARPAVRAATPDTGPRPAVRSKRAVEKPRAAPARKAAPQPQPKPKKTASTPAKRAKKPAAHPEKAAGNVLAEFETEHGERVRLEKVNGRTVRNYIDASGRVVAKNDITPQVRPAMAVPTPTIAQLEMLTHQQAVASAAATAGLVARLGLEQGE